MGGVFWGPDTVCGIDPFGADNFCFELRGACCEPRTGSGERCRIKFEEQCDAIVGATFFGSDSFCGGLSPCEDPIGACCLAGGGCAAVDEDSCLAANGTYTDDDELCVNHAECNDSNGDGTPDISDGCPQDPNKIAPGQCGCGLLDTDSDSDGTADCNDGCPNDGNKTSPGVCGCGNPDGDLDMDGAVDCIDGCPNDGNKTSPGVCGCGTPDVDTDSDGVPDCNDVCPGFDDTVDTDTDGVADGCDGCPNDGNKTSPGICGCGTPDVDSDSDGVPDCNDVCPGFDDNVDTNMNGVPDGCEQCKSEVVCLDNNVCTHNECSGGVCGEFGVSYGDVASPFGGLVATSDILCAVTAFGNYSACPNADIFECLISGIPISTGDILATVAAFGGGDPCGCSGPSAATSTPTPTAGYRLQKGDGHAVVVLSAKSRYVKPGQRVLVDVSVRNAPDLIAYEIRTESSNANLKPESVFVDENHADFAFTGSEFVTAIDKNLNRIGGVAIGESGESARLRYLGTFEYRAASRARGTVSITADPESIQLFRRLDNLIKITSVEDAHIIIATPPKR